MIAMIRVSLVAVAAVSLAACGESYAERDARYQTVKKECVEQGVKAGFAVPGTFSRAHEAASVKVTKECLSSRGFAAEADTMN